MAGTVEMAQAPLAPSLRRHPLPLQPDQTSLPPLAPEQKRNILKSNFEKMKRDANELADLAKALQEELNKSNENILSWDIIDKADRIGKLAKKIKGSARGF
jgi:hypothetical protein